MCMKFLYDAQCKGKNTLLFHASTIVKAPNIVLPACFSVVRPTMPETTALGAAMAAGMAKGVEVWTLNPQDKSQVNTDVFEPAVDPHGKLGLK